MVVTVVGGVLRPWDTEVLGDRRGVDRPKEEDLRDRVVGGASGTWRISLCNVLICSKISMILTR